MTISILLADDHAILRDGLRALLQTQPDLRVLDAVTDGHAAVERARALCPDVAVMDIAMPRLNGIEAAKQICAECPQTKIIILSMHAGAEHIRRALRAGALGYLLKESAGAEVIAAIRAVHAGKRYLSEKISETIVDDYTRARGQNALDQLSAREREVLQLVVEGKSSKAIAKTLGLSAKTVETYRSRLMQKLGVKNLTDLIRFAIQNGVTPLE